MAAPAAEQFTVTSGVVRLCGETEGEGPDIVCAHGLTATRRYVLHGSHGLSRHGFRVSTYDARGHGKSDPSPADQPYTYDVLAEDLAHVLEARAGGVGVLVGHSMGAHTIARLALDRAEGIRAVVFLGPAWHAEPAGEARKDYWDALADGLEEGGPDGFVRALEEQGIDPAWRDTVVRISRDRIALHRHPEAVVRALREVPLSSPFHSMEDLKGIDIPALVIGSRDEADPGHPLTVAEDWADRLPRSTLVVEEPGESPLAWQGGKLSRAIADFLADLGIGDAVAE